MLRVIVPIVYCRNPLDELFSSPCGFYCGRPAPSAAPCCSRRRGGGLMAYPTLATFVEAMEAMEKSEQDCDKKCTNGSCKESTNKTTAEKSRSEPNPGESAKPSSSSEPENAEQSNIPSTSEESQEDKPSEAVTVPMKRLDLSDSDHFQVSLNLKSFQPEHIEVTRVDNELKVHAKEQVERYGMIFHRELHRSYQLPEDVDAETLKSTLSAAGVLTIEAQRRPKASEDAAKQQSENSDHVDPQHVKDSSKVITEQQEKSSAGDATPGSETRTIEDEEAHTTEEDHDDEEATGGQEE